MLLLGVLQCIHLLERTLHWFDQEAGDVQVSAARVTFAAVQESFEGWITFQQLVLEHDRFVVVVAIRSVQILPESRGH